jgi:hypothetical protein
MKDSELRGFVLQAFYRKRRLGWLGIGINTGEDLEFDDRVPQEDVVRIAAQLADAGLLEWSPLKNNRGNLIAGAGQINAFGVDVIEGTETPPIPIHIDMSSHTFTTNISGQNNNVQVAGANSQQSQNISQEVEKLIQAIDSSAATEEEKSEAKGLLAAFLQSSVITALLGGSPVVAKILEYLGK